MQCGHLCPLFHAAPRALRSFRWWSGIARSPRSQASLSKRCHAPTPPPPLLLGVVLRCRGRVSRVAFTWWKPSPCTKRAELSDLVVLHLECSMLQRGKGLLTFLSQYATIRVCSMYCSASTRSAEVVCVLYCCASCAPSLHSPCTNSQRLIPEHRDLRKVTTL